METRAKLLKATFKLVEKKGIDKTTMDDITEKADLGRRTLYYHFGSKEECIIAAVAEEYSKFAQAADQSAHKHEDPAVAVAIAALIVMKALLEAPVTAQLGANPRMLANALKASVRDFIYQDIAIGVEQGRFTPVIEGPLLDTSVMWTMVGFLIETIDNGDQLKDTLCNFIQMHMVFLGLSAQEAIAITDQAVELLNTP